MTQGAQVVADLWRYRGALSQRNFFLVGEGKNGFALKMGPLSLIQVLLPKLVKQLKDQGMVRFAEGTLCLERISFDDCVNPNQVPMILKELFLGIDGPGLKNFHDARVFIGCADQGYSVKHLLGPDMYL